MSGVKDERLNKGAGGQIMSPPLKSGSGERKNFPAHSIFKHLKTVETNGPAIYRNLLGEAPVPVGQTLVSFYSNHNRLQRLLHLLRRVWPCEETAADSTSPNRFWDVQRFRLTLESFWEKVGTAASCVRGLEKPVFMSTLLLERAYTYTTLSKDRPKGK